MKHFVIIFLFVANYLGLSAQRSIEATGNSDVLPAYQSPFLNMQLNGGNYTSKTTLVSNDYNELPSYTINGGVASNAFFSKDWVKGSVSTTDQQTYSEGLLFMFDKVHRQLYFKKIDSSTIMAADMSKVSVFSLITDKQHIFIKGNLLSKDFSADIFEVLVLDEKKFSLLKSIVSVYEESSGNAVAQAMTQSAGKYVDHAQYYIYNNSTLQKTELTKKAFLKLMDSDGPKAESYIHTHHGSFNEAYAINLITYLNQ